MKNRFLRKIAMISSLILALYYSLLYYMNNFNMLMYKAWFDVKGWSVPIVFWLIFLYFFIKDYIDLTRKR